MDKAIVSQGTLVSTLGAVHGDTVVFRIGAVNEPPVGATASGPTTSLITVQDALPAGLAFAPTLSDPRCTATGQAVTCTSPLVLDQGDRPGNYLEASGACMFVYGMAKGVRIGHLPGRWLDVARWSYRGILEHFVQVDPRGEINLHGICGMAGLGGDPYRDGAYIFALSYYRTRRQPAPSV